MFKAIKSFLSKIVSGCHSVDPGSGQWWSLWLKLPWSNGFSGRLGAVHFEIAARPLYDRGPRGWQLAIAFGNGPGYRHGAGLWIGRCLKGDSGVEMYRINSRIHAGTGRPRTPGWW